MATKTVSAPKTTSKSSVPAPKTSAPSAPDSRDYGKSVSYTPNNYSFRNSAPSTAPDSRDYGKSVSYTPSAQTSALYKNGSSSSAVDSRDYGKSVSYTPNNYSFRNSSTNTGGSSVGGSVGQMATQANVPVPTYSPPPTYAAPGTPPPVPTAKANVPPMQTESVSAPQTAVASAVSTGGTTSNVPNPEDYKRLFSELGRSQLAEDVYGKANRPDLVKNAQLNFNQLKAEAESKKYNIAPYLKTGFREFYTGEGPANAYDPQQQGKVLRSVPPPGGPNQTTGNPVKDAQNGLVYKPNESPYAFRTEQQIQAQEHAKTENLIAQQKALASQKKAAYQINYDRVNQQEADQRALDTNQFDRLNNPYSGGSDYRKAMMEREWNITDRQQSEDLLTKLSATDSELYNYIQNASVEEQDRILKQVESERNASLQWRSQDFAEQKGTFDTNYNIGKDKRDFERGVLESNRTFTAQQDAAKRDAAQKDLANEWASSEAIGKVTAKLSKLTGIPAGTPTMEARKMATQQDQFNKNYQLDKDKAAFDKWSEKERIAITKAANQTEKEYKDYLKNQQISETTAKNRTKQAVADVMGADTREEALDILKTTSGQLGQDGVDIREVLAAIDSRYPGGQSSTAEELKQIELELKKQEYQDATGKPYQAPKQVGG